MQKSRDENGKSAQIVIVQRNSPSSGWKVNAINSGISVIGGVEPDLDSIVKKSVNEGILTATHDFNALVDADLILIAIQTDKDGFGPDYKPLLAGLSSLAEVLQNKPPEKKPVIVFESTLAPSSMLTLIKNHFKKYGLEEGKDIFLGNSPNRVMPGRLKERITSSDKLAAGIHPDTSSKIKSVYSHIVTKGKIHETNCLTAEIVKTLENAYRDVRIAFSAEIVRYCDANEINFYHLRDEVNKKLGQSDNASDNPNFVPVGGMLIPTVGVGGHCLPKDGILLLWRMLEDKTIQQDKSLFLTSRIINEESPRYIADMLERLYPEMSKGKIALLGTAYRFNSEDTRNSPSITLGNILINKGLDVILHDPYVQPSDQNLTKYNLGKYFTNDLETALTNVQIVIMCTAHHDYIDNKEQISGMLSLECIIDACNIYRKDYFKNKSLKFVGIGMGKNTASKQFTEFVYNSFIAIEKGVANELERLINYINTKYAFNDYNKVSFKEVQRLAGSCTTGCKITDPATVDFNIDYKGFQSRLVKVANDQQDN